MECCGGSGEAPACGLQGGESEVESNSGRGEAPACLCCHGGDYEATCERSGYGVFILSDGRWCCSSTSVVGPVRWPSWCSMFFGIPIEVGSLREVSRMAYASGVLVGAILLDQSCCFVGMSGVVRPC
jgi:hypothetical protein